MKITSSNSPLEAAAPQSAARAPKRRASLADSGPSRFQRLLARVTAPPAAPRQAAQPAAAQPVANQPVAHQAQTTNVFGLQTAPQGAAPQSAAPAADAVERPTAESVFGPNPWMASPGGSSPGGGAYSYNPTYFATLETAQKVAQMLGGTVVAKNAMVGDTGPFVQQQPNYMVQLPNGHLVNAGLTASYFTHGWSQAFIDLQLGYDRNV